MESASSTSAFVGRDLELATLAATVRDARAGPAGCWSWSGRPGSARRAFSRSSARGEPPVDVFSGAAAPDDAGAPAYEIALLSPLLGRSLETAIRTGLLCRYDPAPETRVTWEVDA